MNKLLTVARHEFKKTVANKAFIIITILGPFLILAVTILPGLLAMKQNGGTGGKPLLVKTGSEMVWEYLEPTLLATGYESKRVDSLEDAKDEVLAGNYPGLVEVPAGWPDEASRFYSKTGTEIYVYSTVESVLDGLATQLHMSEIGLSAEDLSKLLSKPGLTVMKLNPDKGEIEKSEMDYISVLMASMAFSMLLYMTVLLYGQMIGRSIVLEKTNKTVEIMLSSVSSRQLMYGKIIGLGMAALLQYGVWMAMAGIAIKFIGPSLNLSMPETLSISNMAWLIVFFLLGFFLFSSAYAAIGAAAEDEQNMAQLAWPFIIFLMIPMFTATSIVNNPSGPFATILSLFPLTSPMVMLIRILVATPGWIEIALCIIILIASIVGAGNLAARIFRTGILMTGKKFTWKEIIHWLGKN